MDIKSTLQKRGSIYGIFMDNAVISQDLKEVVRNHPSWKELSPDKQEAIEMIFFKISRIITGDPEYKDNWHDIIGYAKLVEDTLNDR